MSASLERIGIHESVSAVFPPDRLRDALADGDGDGAGAGAATDDVDATVAVVDADDVDGCDALVTFAFDEAFLDAGLGWIHSIQAGVDRFPLDALEERGIRLTNSTGIHGDAVGETVAGYMLSFARGLHRYRSNQTRGEWERLPWDQLFTLDGERLCVVGLGTLGRGIATRADGLGMEVVGVKRTPVPVDHVETVYPSSRLHEAIGDARFVALAVPLTDGTRGLIGAAELDAMRDDAVLVNVARGAVVDEPALVEALEAGAIAGAALDVFEREPLPPESPLWDMENVVVTPHFAAVTADYYERVAALVRENVRRSRAGESMVNLVV